MQFEITQGLRVDNLQALQDKVRLRGGRLIAYSEVISAVFISARSYKVKWIPTLQGRKGGGLGSTIITVILGWWSITGPYRSISALIWNFRGGHDITDSLLRAHPGNLSFLGYTDTVEFDKFQESSSRLAFRICFRIALFAVITLGVAIWHHPTQK